MASKPGRREGGHPSRDVFHSLLRVSGRLESIMQTYFGRFGISASQWAVLRNLHRAETEGLSGLRPADLVGRMLVRPPSVTGLLDRMERLGYVRRSGSAQDLRCKEVRLTLSGRRIVERILPRHSDEIASLMNGLHKDEQKQLHKMLARLEAHLQSIDAKKA